MRSGRGERKLLRSARPLYAGRTHIGSDMQSSELVGSSLWLPWVHPIDIGASLLGILHSLQVPPLRCLPALLIDGALVLLTQPHPMPFGRIVQLQPKGWTMSKRRGDEFCCGSEAQILRLGRRQRNRWNTSLPNLRFLKLLSVEKECAGYPK